MTHRRLVLLLVPLCLIAVLLPGCEVRITEPLSDPDKAEPDKRLHFHHHSTGGATLRAMSRGGLSVR